MSIAAKVALRLRKHAAGIRKIAEQIESDPEWFTSDSFEDGELAAILRYAAEQKEREATEMEKLG